MNRRGTGVNHVVMEDEGGQTVRMVTATAKTGQAIMAFILAFCALVGTLVGVVKWGADVHVKDQVEALVADDDSGVHLQIQGIAAEEAAEMSAVVQDDLDVFEGELKEHGKAITRVETQQQAISDKLDDSEEELLREIRRAAGGGS